MEWLTWVDARVQEVLTERLEVLDHWRRQVLSTSNRVKNFENWILVELVHRLLQAGVTEIQTNGYLERPSYPIYPDSIKEMQSLLRGTKAKSKSISPDLAFRLHEMAFLINLEIKTQNASQEVIDDAHLVKYHNEHENKSNYRAGFLWVVVAPNEPVLQSRVLASAAKIVEKLGKEDIRVRPKKVNNQEWLTYSLSAPGFNMAG